MGDVPQPLNPYRFFYFMTFDEIVKNSRDFLNWWKTQYDGDKHNIHTGFIYHVNDRIYCNNHRVSEYIFWNLETLGEIVKCAEDEAYFSGILAHVYRPKDGKLHPTETSRKSLTTIEKARVFAKCDFKCVKCNSEENLQIDHIYPVSKGGGNSPENLQILCRTCNIKKRDKYE